MWHKLIASALLFVGISAAVVAQEKDNTSHPPQKNEDIIIHKKGNSSHGKTTIVIDGDNITINGKPVSEFKSADIELIRNHDMAFAMPREMRNQRMKVFNDGNLLVPGNKAFLGVGSEKAEKGARIISISKGSPAEKAGLQKEDIITKIDAQKIESSEDLYDAISKYNPGDKVQVTYLRDNKESSVTIPLDKNEWVQNLQDLKFNGDDFNFEMPDISELRNFNYHFTHTPKLGLQIQELETGKGIAVQEVNSGTPASKAGLQKGDVITEVNGKEVDDIDDLKSRLKDTRDGDTIQLTYKRDGKVQSAEIRFPKKLKTVDL